MSESAARRLKRLESRVDGLRPKEQPVPFYLLIDRGLYEEARALGDGGGEAPIRTQSETSEPETHREAATGEASDWRGNGEIDDVAKTTEQESDYTRELRYLRERSGAHEATNWHGVY